MFWFFFFLKEEEVKSVAPTETDDGYAFQVSESANFNF